MKEVSVPGAGKARRVQGESSRTRPSQVDLSDSEILQRGLEAFAELGYQGTSVRELAKRLQVSHNFIHDRFASKNNFWRAAVDHALRGPMRELLCVFDRDTDDAEKFKAVVRTFYSISANAPHVNRIISDEAVFNSDRLDYVYGEYTGPFLERLEPLVRRLIDSGRMPEMSMDVLFSALTGPAVVLTQKPLGHRIRKAGDLPDAAEWGQRANSLANVVIRGLFT